MKYTLEEMIRDLEELRREHGGRLEVRNWETNYRVIDVRVDDNVSDGAKTVYIDTDL